MASLDSADRVGEPAPHGFASERLGVWLMGAYWLALLVVGMVGTALSGH
jgi:hypothetical protein